VTVGECFTRTPASPSLRVRRQPLSPRWRPVAALQARALHAESPRPRRPLSVPPSRSCSPRYTRKIADTGRRSGEASTRFTGKWRRGGCTCAARRSRRSRSPYSRFESSVYAAASSRSPGSHARSQGHPSPWPSSSAGTGRGTRSASGTPFIWSPFAGGGHGFCRKTATAGTAGAPAATAGSRRREGSSACTRPIACWAESARPISSVRPASGSALTRCEQHDAMPRALETRNTGAGGTSSAARGSLRCCCETERRLVGRVL
jgi:hypothetical protein